MAVTNAASGSQTAVVGTEHTLFDSAAAATYQGAIDMVNMAAGDIVEIRVYEMIDGTNRRVIYKATMGGAQPADDLGKLIGPYSTDLATSGATRLTLKQTAGTARTFPWRVRKFA